MIFLIKALHKFISLSVNLPELEINYFRNNCNAIYKSGAGVSGLQNHLFFTEPLRKLITLSLGPPEFQIYDFLNRRFKEIM